MTDITDDVTDDPEHDEWDRQVGEQTRYYSAFRLYRDLAPHARTHEGMTAVAQATGLTERRCRQIAQRWRWRERCEAWDDACHRLEDRQRLDAIREMHELHRRAGRKAITVAISALDSLDQGGRRQEMNVTQIARLMALGAKLERDTLLTSVEELQGVEEADEVEDAWDVIARELAGDGE